MNIATGLVSDQKVYIELILYKIQFFDRTSLGETPPERNIERNLGVKQFCFYFYCIVLMLQGFTVRLFRKLAHVLSLNKKMTGLKSIDLILMLHVHYKRREESDFFFNKTVQCYKSTLHHLMDTI